ncbi:MAG: hypothetical protein QMD09_07375 [Desulfatibacillaceae bacterium]|nr:hypothetical protein [Desulfatibacillaceae bacterium]
MNEKENSNYQPRKARKKIQQPTCRLVRKSRNPYKMLSLGFQLHPQAINGNPKTAPIVFGFHFFSKFGGPAQNTVRY